MEESVDECQEDDNVNQEREAGLRAAKRRAGISSWLIVSFSENICSLSATCIADSGSRLLPGSDKQAQTVTRNTIKQPHLLSSS